MSLGDRLGIVGVVVALFAIAAPYLWPDRKWIGWLSLILAGVLLLGWAVLEIQGRVRNGYASLIWSVAAGMVIGGVVAALIWSSWRPTAERQDTVGLRPRIDALGSGSMAANKNGFTTFASLIITVINDGAPTLAEEFQLQVTFANGVSVAGFLLTIPDDGIAIDYPNGKSEIILRTETLDTLSMHPIIGKIQGRLIYAFKGVTAAEILDVGTKAQLSMKDGAGKLYSTPPFSTKEIRLGPDVDFPGLRPVGKLGLRGQFLQTIVGQTTDPSIAVGFVEMTITNEGIGKSTAKPDGWSLTVTLGGISHRGKLIAIQDGTQMQMAEGKTYGIDHADAIYEKTSKGIEPGSIAHGWIQAAFKGIKPNDLVSEGARWEINFEDHLGVRYTASYQYTGGERQPEPQYYPGGGIKP